MQVFGDRMRCLLASALADDIAAALDRAERAAPSLVRHEALVEALIGAGELAQGLADAGHDAGPAMALALAVAHAVADSWTSGFRSPSRESLRVALRRCVAGLPEQARTPRAPAPRPPSRMRERDLSVRVPEGYAFYALYPECFLKTARRMARAAAPGTRWQVIGVRSIGTSLAAMVAAGLGAGVPATVRPVGPPYERSVDADPRIIDRDADRYAIVDEGPGRSGSSLAAVARWLHRNGVPYEAQHFLPSHGGGPGPCTTEANRQVWCRVKVAVTSFDAAILGNGECDEGSDPPPLQAWARATTGALRSPLIDIGGGGWRDRHEWLDSARRPPAHPWQERRKFIAPGADGSDWLLRFAGLGRHGRERFGRMQQLAGAGFCLRPAALHHGFTVERWRADLVPAPPALRGPWRARWLHRVAEYLAFRSRHFAVPDSAGASLLELATMARRNAQEAFGDRFEPGWSGWEAACERLGPRVRRIETDNRLHSWEWLALGATVLKTDAVDHAVSHDLVGGQDVAWDLAGAIAEFELDTAERAALCAHVRRHGVGGDDALVALLLPCYLAFQMGAFVDAAGAAAGEDADLLDRHARRYRDGLSTVLGTARMTASMPTHVAAERQAAGEHSKARALPIPAP